MNHDNWIRALEAHAILAMRTKPLADIAFLDWVTYRTDHYLQALLDLAREAAGNDSLWRH